MFAVGVYGYDRVTHIIQKEREEKLISLEI